MFAQFENPDAGDSSSYAQFFVEKEPAHKLWALWAGLLTAVGWFLCLPPFDFAEFAYAFAIPLIYWAYLRPPFKLYALSALGASALAWVGIFWWLHHVTWLGLPFLGIFMGLWSGLWFLLVWWVMPRMAGRSMWLRLLAMFGLAGAWVLIEWTKTWFLSGLPWLPLAASQWQRVAVLQISSYTGAGGVSFVLICMNIGLAAYGYRLLKEKKKGLAKRSQESFMAFFLLVLCLSIFFTDALRKGSFSVPVGRVGFVQPNIPQSVKWDPGQVPVILSTLKTTTREIARYKPDVILWPEATTPLALKGNEGMRGWVEGLVKDVNIPLLTGAIGIEDRGNGVADWYNSVFYVRPDTGVDEVYYSKRHLVPFGEYVPMRSVLGWVTKVSDAGEGDFAHGEGDGVLPLEGWMLDDPTSGKEGLRRPIKAGMLICYEDIFPGLARESTLGGADLLIVQTNNAWFGEGAMAYQHAAHSVLRAVETRRPVLRVGNAGWSGWIDEFGSIRAVLSQTPEGIIRMTLDKEKPGTIYFRGVSATDVSVDRRWIGQMSFYVRYGEWFTILCGGFLIATFLILRKISLAEKPKSNDNKTS